MDESIRIGGNAASSNEGVTLSRRVLRPLLRWTVRGRLSEWGRVIRADAKQILSQVKAIRVAGKDAHRRLQKVSKTVEHQGETLRAFRREMTEFESTVTRNLRSMERHMSVVRKLGPYLMAIEEEQLLQEGRFRDLYLSEIWKDIEKLEVSIGCINEASQHTNHINLLYVVAVAKHLRAKQIFEFGTWLGKTTYHLAGATDETHVVTLDLPPDQAASGAHQGHFFKTSDRSSRITALELDARDFDASGYEGAMDFVFIDGDHSYEGVKSDTENALRMLKPGGTVIWDDCDGKNPDVLRYLRDFSRERAVFLIRNTCLAAYREGVDALTFEPIHRDFPQDWKAGARERERSR